MTPKAVLSGREIVQAYHNYNHLVSAQAQLRDAAFRTTLYNQLEDRVARLKDQPRIWIDNFDEPRAYNSPNSYDLTLAPELQVYDLKPVDPQLLRSIQEYPPFTNDPALDVSILDMKKANPALGMYIPPEGLVLWPGILYLGRTAEYTEAHNLVPHIDGRSSVGRLGLNVHVTAGRGDAGFCGTWTLEMTVVHPLRVYAGVRICQVEYWPISLDHTPYRGKYDGQKDVTPSKLAEDFRPPHPRLADRQAGGSE